MATVKFLGTLDKGGQEVMGYIRFDPQTHKLTVDPEVESFADFLLEKVDPQDPVAIVAALKTAPEHFDGGYVRAAYED
jgi:hypothetical protein